MVRTRILGFGYLVVVVMGCGGSEPPPPLAPDRTAPGTERSTPATTCQWVPPLPDFREDPCTHMQQGTTLEITERPDMREESASRETHTCSCN